MRREMLAIHINAVPKVIERSSAEKCIKNIGEKFRMLILLVPILIAVSSVVMLTLDQTKYSKSFLFPLGVFLLLISLCTLTAMAIPIATNSHISNQIDEYVDMKLEYYYLCDNISEDESDPNFAATILKAVEYNKKISKSKKYKDNVWIGRFYNPYLAKLELIDIPIQIEEK